MNSKKLLVLTIALIINISESLAQISTADEDDFNYEHQLIYLNAATITQGDKSHIDYDIVKEYDFSSKDYRYIYWVRVPRKDMTSYLPWNIEKVLKLEYLGEKYIRGAFTYLVHRDCERNLVLTTKFLNDNKTITLSWEWFSNQKKEEAKYLKGCPVIKKNIPSDNTKNAIFRGKNYQKKE